MPHKNMIEYQIKTWSCQCGYQQDFEPSRLNMHEHFNKDTRFKLNDLKENECPACALKGTRNSVLIRETDSAKKIKHVIQEETDDIEPAKKSKMEFLSKKQIKDLRDKHEDK